LLLAKIADWEKVASSRVTLRDFFPPLARVVLRLRRIEVSSWKRLLEDVKNQACYDARAELPRLLRAIGEAMDSDAHIIAALFMDFLGQQATLLDFEQRVEMVACIVGCCRKMQICSSQVAVDAVAHVALYFAQFLPQVRDHCSRVREPIENELKELLKLGKWDTYDYNMLKDTIEKSHRQLHRLSVKLVTELRSPLSGNFVILMFLSDFLSRLRIAPCSFISSFLLCFCVDFIIHC
jgi:midasin